MLISLVLSSVWYRGGGGGGGRGRESLGKKGKGGVLRVEKEWMSVEMCSAVELVVWGVYRGYIGVGVVRAVMVVVVGTVHHKTIAKIRKLRKAG